MFTREKKMKRTVDCGAGRLWTGKECQDCDSLSPQVLVLYAQWLGIDVGKAFFSGLPAKEMTDYAEYLNIDIKKVLCPLIEATLEKVLPSPASPSKATIDVTDPVRIEKVNDNVWTTAIRSSTNPNVNIYFGMERLVSDRQIANWKTYSEYACGLSHQSTGVLGKMMRYSDPMIRKEDNISYDTYAWTGISEERFDEMMRYFESVKAYKSSGPARETMSGVCAGSQEFTKLATKGNYVIYASKRPVNGVFPFPILPPEMINMKNKAIVLKIPDFDHYFNNILMAMIAQDMPQSPLFHHRGIFVNPLLLTVPDKTYRGISLKLHAFSSKVFLEEFGKKYMVVSPIRAMEKILVPAFSKGEIYSKSGSSVPLFTQFPGGWKFGDAIKKLGPTGFEEDTFLIDAKALSNKLRAPPPDASGGSAVYVQEETCTLQ